MYGGRNGTLPPTMSPTTDTAWEYVSVAKLIHMHHVVPSLISMPLYMPGDCNSLSSVVTVSGVLSTQAPFG